MLNDRIYNIQDFDDLNMFDIRYLLNPSKVTLNFDYRTKETKPNEDVYVWDFLDPETNS
jgi:hypothetical protein